MTPGDPTFNTMATINGVSQSIAGGSVTATAPVASVAISGTNLDEVIFLKQGNIVRFCGVDEIRSDEGKSVDALFREVFRC